MQYFPQIILKFVGKSPKIIIFLNTQQLIHSLLAFSPKIFWNYTVDSPKFL